MGLSIGVQAGDHINIGDKTLVVQEVGPKLSVVVYDGGKAQMVSEEERSMLAPEVYVSLGKAKGHSSRHCRLVFEAPRSIRIGKVSREH